MEEVQVQQQILDPEMEFLASKRETGNEWELFKENVRPLKRGRNISTLNGALSAQSPPHSAKTASFAPLMPAGSKKLSAGTKAISLPQTPYQSPVFPMSALSGSEGFLCGISSNTSQAFCWELLNPGGMDLNLVAKSFNYNSNSQIAVGKSHDCAIRGSYLIYSDKFGSIDCWEFYQTPGGHGDFSVLSTTSNFNDPYLDKAVFRMIVSGDGFSCGVVKEGGVVCWVPKSSNLGVSTMSGKFQVLASSRSSVCGISNVSSEVECWGDSNEFDSPPSGIRFVGLAASARHFCGIREDDHGVECWGNIDASSIPKD